MSKGQAVGYHPGMRFRRGLLALVLVTAGCTTPPPPPSVIQAELTSYSSSTDAPRILESLKRAMAESRQSPADLSTPDLSLYSSLLLSAGRFPEAEESLEVLQGRIPRDRDVLWKLTLLAGAKGREAQAKRLAAFEAAWPDTTQALGLKARMALEAKKPQEALAFAERAVRAAPDDDSLWALKAQILVDLERYPEARRDLDQAVALAPEDPWHRLDRGRLAFRHLYAFEPARADLEFSTIKNPSNFLGWELLAEVYEELDRPRQAWNAWQKTLSLRPDYGFAYPSAAMLAFRYQDWEQAIRYAREAAKAYPGEYAFVFVEALSLRATGQLKASQTVLEKARPRFERGSIVDTMFRFLLTPGSDYYLNAALNQEKQENVRLRLRFYQGCYYALTKSPASARAAFDEVQSSTLLKIPEITAARDWLENGL